MSEQKWRNEFSKRLKDRIEYLGLSYTEVAKRTGTVQSEISKWVRAAHTPNTYYVIKLSKVLAMDIADLIDY